MRRLDELRRARRSLSQADQQQRRLEGHRRETVDRQARRRAVRGETGHDRHSSGEAAERVAQGARVVPAAIFVPRRLVSHVSAYNAPALECQQALWRQGEHFGDRLLERLGYEITRLERVVLVRRVDRALDRETQPFNLLAFEAEMRLAEA